MTQVHFPTLTHPDFAGRTGAGDIGDAMADVDFNVGLILETLERLSIDRNTIVLWCTDNGPEGRRPWRGSSGPWRGFYNSVMEGGIRTPCVIRWPARIPRGQISNEIVHELDLFPTLAAAAGADIPTDRPIDGVNILPFLEGRQQHSGRESALFFTGNQIRAVKWKDWKFHYAFMPEPRVTEPPLMRLFNLRSDPREESDIKDANPWAIGLFDGIVAEFNASVERFPNLPADTRDPYVPRGAANGALTRCSIPDVGGPRHRGRRTIHADARRLDLETVGRRQAERLPDLGGLPAAIHLRSRVPRCYDECFALPRGS
jgi:arylsulfatase